MPDPKDHQAKADHNRGFLNTLDDTCLDWKATVAFYVAVHLVEKLRAYRGQHSENHADRMLAVNRDFRAIAHPYRELYNAAWIARYAPLRKFTLTVADVNDTLIGKHLAAIEAFVAAETKARTTPATKPGTPPKKKP